MTTSVVQVATFTVEVTTSIVEVATFTVEVVTSVVEVLTFIVEVTTSAVSKITAKSAKFYRKGRKAGFLTQFPNFSETESANLSIYVSGFKFTSIDLIYI